VSRCLGCGQRQPDRGYIQCFECGHVYRTRWHLLAAYWRAAGLRHALKSLRLRPSGISFCQCCIHDL